VIGTGPGSSDFMSKRAADLLSRADVVAGYTTYLDLIQDQVKGKRIIATAMKKEVERVETAVNSALDGEETALISGGDPGIYAMAGLVFELCRKRGIPLVRPGVHEETPPKGKGLVIEIVPGIPALAAGASVLGAPLTHDFAAVSLSDLLTPWEKIEKRLAAAAEADFVIALYNPKSKKRNWQLSRAREIIMAHRDGGVSVGIVTSAMRDNQKVVITTLAEMDRAEVGMQTIIFVGSSASLGYLDFMYTPRGYAGKYPL